jgi:hypothetical protein
MQGGFSFKTFKGASVILVIVHFVRITPKSTSQTIFSGWKTSEKAVSATPSKEAGPKS